MLVVDLAINDHGKPSRLKPRPYNDKSGHH